MEATASGVMVGEDVVLASVGALRVTAVRLPQTPHVFEIERPVDCDRLLDEAAADPEQNLPYWAEIWPSGVALAARIAMEPHIVQGKLTLELGCGLGVTAIAALAAGADLLATDYALAALALAALNARRALGAELRTMQCNWRDPLEFPRAPLAERYDVVLAADVLYERRDVDPLVATIERVTAPDGEVFLAEPGRPPAAQFLDHMAARGWKMESEHCLGPWPDPEDNRKGVVVTVHRLRRRFQAI